MDIKKLMKQAQTMQKKMQEMQEEIAKKEFEGKSGGGLSFSYHELGAAKCAKSMLINRL